MNDTNAEFNPRLPQRRIKAKAWRLVFSISIIVALVFLVALLGNIVNASFGFAILEYETAPETLVHDGKAYTELEAPDLVLLLEEQLSGRRLRALEREQPFAERSRDNLLAVIDSELLAPEIYKTYTLLESGFAKREIANELEAAPEGSRLVFRSWVSKSLLTKSQSDRALDTGIRSALLGSIFTVIIAILFSVPLGIAASVWLEEYINPKSRLNSIFSLNIYNLAGVPSIIYGMLEIGRASCRERV